MVYPDSWRKKFAIDGSRLLEEEIDLGLSLIVVPYNSETAQSMDFNWTFSELKPDKLGIKLEFERPSAVSMSSQDSVDQLEIEFTDKMIKQLVD